MASEDGSLDLRQDRLVEADDAGEAFLASAHPRQQVVAKLGLNRLRDMAGGS